MHLLPLVAAMCQCRRHLSYAVDSRAGQQGMHDVIAPLPWPGQMTLVWLTRGCRIMVKGTGLWLRQVKSVRVCDDGWRAAIRGGTEGGKERALELASKQ